jgi:predicted secreted hydrolase
MQLTDTMQKAVDLGSSGLDVIHGELKWLMKEAEEQLELAQEAENKTGEAMDSMDRKYWEGQLDALGHLYQLTYSLSFAISERDNK